MRTSLSNLTKTLSSKKMHSFYVNYLNIFIILLMLNCKYSKIHFLCERKHLIRNSVYHVYYADNYLILSIVTLFSLQSFLRKWNVPIQNTELQSICKINFIGTSMIKHINLKDLVFSIKINLSTLLQSKRK